MTLVFKASLFTRGRHCFLRATGLKKEFVSLVGKQPKHVCESLTSDRFYSTKVEDLPLENRKRLYDGTLATKIRRVKIFSLATSALSLAGQPYLISKAIAAGSGKFLIGSIITTLGFFSFGTPLLLHIVMRRYIIYLDYNPDKDTYIATTWSLFAQKKELEFTPDDVKLPQYSEILTTCFIKGYPMFMDVHLFTDVSHYKRIMGFDKPMELVLEVEDETSKKK